MHKKSPDNFQTTIMGKLKKSSLIVSVEPTGATETKGIWTIITRTQKLQQAKTYIAETVGSQNMEKQQFNMSRNISRPESQKRDDSIGSYASILKNMVAATDKNINTSRTNEFDACPIHRGRIAQPILMVTNPQTTNNKGENVEVGNNSPSIGTKPQIHQADIANKKIEILEKKILALDEAAIISKLEKSLSKKMEEIIADKQSQKEATRINKQMEKKYYCRRSIGDDR